MIANFQTISDAEGAGWLIRPPAVAVYRGWGIMTTQNISMRLFGRTISGALVNVPVKWPDLRIGLGNGKKMRFSYVWLKHAEQPPTGLIYCAEVRNMLGDVPDYTHATRREDWQRAADQIMRIIDVRLDGRTNLDECECIE